VRGRRAIGKPFAGFASSSAVGNRLIAQFSLYTPGGYIKCEWLTPGIGPELALMAAVNRLMRRVAANQGERRKRWTMAAPTRPMAWTSTASRSAPPTTVTGCAIGDYTGMMIAMSLGWSDLASIALAVALAYLFGFTLTARPLVKAGLATSAVISTALAADTLSITIMEVIDNLFVLLIPGAMEADIDDPLIYASIAGGFVVAYPFAFVANRYMIARGKGHALVHEHHAGEHRTH
jgi:Domain of unknown function (DUF4396)